jgi:chromosome segregation ATPase
MPAEDFEVRLARTEAFLDGIRRVMDERSQADRTVFNEKLTNLGAQMVTLASAQDRLAPLNQVDRLEVRITAVEGAVAQIVPRPELQKTFEGLETKIEGRFSQANQRLESVGKDVQRLNSSLLKLTTVLQEDETQAKVSMERANTNRSKVFGYVASLTAVAGLCVSLILGLRSHDAVPPAPITVATTTTTVPR